MRNGEIKVDLVELESAINQINNLKNQIQGINVVRKRYENFFISNKGRTAEIMNVCEGKSIDLKNNMSLLIGQTSVFLQNVKLYMEENDKYISSKIDTITK